MQKGTRPTNLFMYNLPFLSRQAVSLVDVTGIPNSNISTLTGPSTRLIWIVLPLVVRFDRRQEAFHGVFHGIFQRELVVQLDHDGDAVELRGYAESDGRFVSLGSARSDTF